MITEDQRAKMALTAMRILILQPVMPVRNAVREAVHGAELKKFMSMDDWQNIEQRVMAASMALYNRVPVLGEQR